VNNLGVSVLGLVCLSVCLWGLLSLGYIFAMTPTLVRAGYCHLREGAGGGLV